MEVKTTEQRRTASRGAIRAACACALAAAAFALPPLAFAQQAGDPAKEHAAPSAIELPLKPNPEFAQLPRYVGMLGKRQIEMRLGPKTDDPTGVHGEYQFTDTGEVILIAGDREAGTLEAEESNDGTHVTGNWVGTFSDDGSLSGERMEVDDSNPVDFDLKPLAAGVPEPAAAAAPKVAQAASPAAGGSSSVAPAATGGEAVNGAGNLKTGE